MSTGKIIEGNTASNVDQIAKAISKKISEKVESQKIRQEKDIEKIKKDTAKAKKELTDVFLKLKLLYKDQADKTKVLDGHYHEALANMAIVNAKLENIGKEISTKLSTIEESFLHIFQNDEKIKYTLREIVNSVKADKKRLQFLSGKVLGKPFSESKKPLFKRIQLLESLVGKQVRTNTGLMKKIKELEKEFKIAKETQKTHEKRIAALENRKITKLFGKLVVPFKRAFDKLTIAIAKTILIKLLIFIIVALGLMSYLDDYIELILNDLF